MVIVAFGTLLVLLAVALWLPVPYIKLSPGPTFNVIGEAEGKPMISITGTQTYPVTGNLDMTTVYESGGPNGKLTFVDAVASWLNPKDAIVPRELMFPDQVSSDEIEQRNAMLFSTSQSAAIAAAMDYLDKPVTSTPVVSAVYSDTPADGVLEAKDEIVSVNGEQIDAAAQVATAVRGKPAGSTFDIVVRRGDGDAAKDLSVQVTSEPNPEDTSIPYIGIGVSDLYAADFPIEFTLDDVGGPSAGLMFAAGIVDLLTPGDLAGGKHIAGTGTIEPDGTVGPIGGIRQKLVGARDAGATLFVMPADHCGEIEGHVPDGLTVVPVHTLTEAVAAIEDYKTGTPLETCPVGVS
jgi:PDZ domain-containing protein